MLARCALALPLALLFLPVTSGAERPHIVLVMADDLGWAQTGYYNHPVLKTPHLDAMASNGLQCDRFYAAAPVCSPTRASVLTGRSNMRTGVESHGYALRLQEKTLPTALREAGYVTGHFGKWHLNGLRGPGVPILANDSHHPGIFGFTNWLSVTNFFDRNPILSRAGNFEEFQGDSSEIIVDEALKFIAAQVKQDRPTFTVIWYGTPHKPFFAAPADTAAFADLDPSSRDHYGELVAMDRSIGALRRGLRDMGIAQNTLVWFTSDNGGLPGITPSSVGPLRGFKGSLYEGGLRVPAILEWPARIKQPRRTEFPAVAMDIFPTLVDILDLPETVMLQPCDGISLQPLFDQEIARRPKPIPFSCFGNHAIIDNDYKIVKFNKKQRTWELYHLGEDPAEKTNLVEKQPQVAERMRQLLATWQRSREASFRGADYPEGKVTAGNPSSRFWTELDAYRPYFPEWRKRPEYASRLNKKSKK